VAALTGEKEGGSVSVEIWRGAVAMAAGSGQMVSGDKGGGGGMLKCEQEAVEDGGAVKGCNGCHSVAFN
jgi:hypothetical protein